MKRKKVIKEFKDESGMTFRFYNKKAIKYDGVGNPHNLINFCERKAVDLIYEHSKTNKFLFFIEAKLIDYLNKGDEYTPEKFVCELFRKYFDSYTGMILVNHPELNQFHHIYKNHTIVWLLIINPKAINRNPERPIRPDELMHLSEEIKRKFIGKIKNLNNVIFEIIPADQCDGIFPFDIEIE